MTNSSLKLLVVLGDGGHTTETCRLVDLLGPGYAYTYVVADSDHLSARRIPFPGPIHRLRRPRAKDDMLLIAIFKTALSMLNALRVCLAVRPDAVLGTGPALMVPIAVAAKLSGSKVIFVETGSRVTQLSWTGKIMLRFADLFFVQWEPLRERYPQAIFAGRLL